MGAVLGDRRWLACFAALALLALAPRILWSAVHDHGLVNTAGDACAACVVAHTPAALDATPDVLPPPIARRAEAVSQPRVELPGGFSFAAPLACGPPA